MIFIGNRKGLNITQPIGSRANEKEHTVVGDQLAKFRSGTSEVKRDAISQRDNAAS